MAAKKPGCRREEKDERAFGDSATPTVPFLAELVGGEGDSVGSFVPSVHCQLAPIWRPLLSGWMGRFLAGLNHQGFLLLGGRMEVPPPPSLASSTRRAALLKRGQNINCGYPWGVSLHVRPNTLLFHILYLIFIYNEHMT